MERLLVHILRFVILVFVQVFLLKNIGFYNLSTPYLYILFILLLPFKIPNWLLFTLSFAMGITIDAFYDTLGLHALASTVLAFSRILFISVTVSPDEMDEMDEPEPGIKNMGFRWFFIYGFMLTLIHHTSLFTAETFHFYNFGSTLLSSILSTVFTLFLILLTQFLFFRKKMR